MRSREVGSLLHTFSQTERNIVHTGDIGGVGLSQLAIIARLTTLFGIVDSGIEQEVLRACRDVQRIDLAGVGRSAGMGRIGFPKVVKGKRVVGIHRTAATGGIFEAEQIHLVDALEDAVADDFGCLTRPFLRLRHI